MLKRRIIPCLDVQNGRTVKGINFKNIIDAGNPITLAKRYAEHGADELVFLDISATLEQRATWISTVRQIAQEINIPFTVGGGIRSVDDARALLQAGADKISINSAAIQQPTLITELAHAFGSQCVVVALDIQNEGKSWEVYTRGGTQPTGWLAIAWADQAARLGAGELLITAMNNDGTQEGFALPITKKIAASVPIPVIASGGAGTYRHFKDVFEQTQATGALAASVFHYQTLSIPPLKSYLQRQNIPIR